MFVFKWSFEANLKGVGKGGGGGGAWRGGGGLGHTIFG